MGQLFPYVCSCKFPIRPSIQKQDPMPNRETLRILIVEENVERQLLLQNTLVEVNEFIVKTVSASSYDEGVKIFIDGNIDVCMVAGNLGSETGKAYLKKLSDARIEKPLVFLYINEPDDRVVADDGVNDYILYKNITPELLNNSIRHAIEHNEAKLLAKAHQERSNSLFYGSLEAIFTVDEDYNILECNGSFLQLLKIDNHQQLNIEEIFPGVKSIEELFSMSKIAQKKRINKKRILNSLGEEIVAYLSISPIKTDIDAAKYMGIIHDVTDLENAQSKLAETEKLAMIHRMARIIGHEVRNPLTNILLATEEIKEECGDNEDAVIMLDMIHRNADRISSLIDNFLKNARTSDFTKGEVMLESVVNESIQTCQDRITLKKINFSQEGVVQKTPLFLDSDKVGIAFTNILINAIEALECCDTPTLKVAIEANEETASVKIEDNGIGMSEETLTNLFNPFYSNKQGGLGLGMANARNIFNAHNASIEVESVLNKGTTFTIQFPLTAV